MRILHHEIWLTLPLSLCFGKGQSAKQSAHSARGCHASAAVSGVYPIPQVDGHVRPTRPWDPENANTNGMAIQKLKRSRRE